jgi:hypothetical protein
LVLPTDDPGDVLVDLLLVIRLDQALSSLDREDNLNLDLRVGVGHVEFGCSRSDLPTFRSAGAETLFLCAVSTNMWLLLEPAVFLLCL